MGLDGSMCSECFPERACLFQPPEQVPRTSAGAQTWVLGPGELHMCHGAESTRRDPRLEEKKNAEGCKKHIYIYIYTYIYIYMYLFGSSWATWSETRAAMSGSNGDDLDSITFFSMVADADK